MTDKCVYCSKAAWAGFNQMPGATHVEPYRAVAEEPQEQEDGDL